MKQIINTINHFVKNLEYSEYADGIEIKKDFLDLRHGSLDYSQISTKFNRYFNSINKSEIISYKYSQDSNLLKKISLIEHVPLENIIITDGTDSALHHVSETFLSIGKKSLILVPSFPRTEFHTRVVGAKPIFINTYKYSEDEKLKSIILKIKKEKINVIFLESPNNPTGEVFSLNGLSYFLNQIGNIVTVIDQSLSGYYNNSLSELIVKFPNLIVIKSFSKLFGLPGLRIGYLITSRHLIKFIKKIISPYEVSTFSIEVAKEFIDNQFLIQFRRNQVFDSIKYLKYNLIIKVPDSKGPFVLLDGTKKIPNLYNKLLKQKMIVVNGINFRGLENTNTVRVSLTNFEYIKKITHVMNQL